MEFGAPAELAMALRASVRDCELLWELLVLSVMSPTVAYRCTESIRTPGRAVFLLPAHAEHSLYLLSSRVFLYT